MNQVTVERFEDMSPDGRLRVTFQTDGDVVLTIVQSEESRKSNFNPGSVCVEFCTHAGGGKSKRTLLALRNLAKAISDDNREEDTRRGKINDDLKLWFPEN